MRQRACFMVQCPVGCCTFTILICIVEGHLSNDLINKLFIFSPFVLAVLPAFMPTWRWYLATTILFIGAISASVSVAVAELEIMTTGEGPAAFGIAIYIWLAGVLFLVATVLRLIVYLVLRYARRRL